MIKIKNKILVERILICALFITVIISAIIIGNLRNSINLATQPKNIVWQYFDDDYGFNRFLLEYPHGWTVDNVNHPKQYVFESPNIQKKELNGRLQILKGAWISLSLEQATEKSLESLKKELEKSQGIEIQSSKLLNQEALWYKEKETETADDRVNLVTIKNNIRYSLLLVYSSNDSDSVNYYTVFNGISDRLINK